MRMYDVIQKKRDGGSLTFEEIGYVIEGYTQGDIPDYQMSALAMAIFYTGMTDEETSALTYAMANSGDVLDLSMFGDLSVDKHSTGGVGDKTTIAVAPIAASLGLYTAKMSGRGLGHTGGTVDKLESIPGFRTSLSVSEFISQVDKHGIAVIGQNADFAPADKKLYALRDVTATVDSLPLIASSIMSKKIAAGAKNIVLDVKTGSGAFMKTENSAYELASKMVDIGKRCGRNTSAIITNMDVPLGNAVGNSLELTEAFNTLRGEGPSDFTELCTEVASKLLVLAKRTPYLEAVDLVKKSISSGKAFEKLLEWISAQGGDYRYAENSSLFSKASVIKEIKAPRCGYITSMNAERIGISAVVLGAGRETKSDLIDHSAGIVIEAKTGSFVKEGDVIATVYTSSSDKAENGERIYLDSVVIGEEKPTDIPLIYRHVD